jgi:NAD(P)-dependent dehydrogenase (short-subunit alcohol dehydrogenase family)
MTAIAKSLASTDRPSRLAPALITGGTAGIGFHTAAALSRLGMPVIVTGRDETRGRRAVSELRSQAGHDAVDLIVSDAFSIRENVRLADEVSRRVEGLGVLINNVGGGGFAERRETPEGLEATLALNFVGPFALTNRLWPLLANKGPGRVINIVSSAFEMWKRDPFDDLDARSRYVGIEAYGHAKLLNLLFTLALARRLTGTNVSANAVNPGMAWTPGVAALTPQAVPQWRYVWPVVRWFQRRASAETAARGPVFLAIALDATVTGRYFEGEKEKPLPKHLLDVGLQDRVWALGESLVGQALVPEA